MQIKALILLGLLGFAAAFPAGTETAAGGAAAGVDVSGGAAAGGAAAGGAASGGAAADTKGWFSMGTDVVKNVIGANSKATQTVLGLTGNAIKGATDLTTGVTKTVSDLTQKGVDLGTSTAKAGVDLGVKITNQGIDGSKGLATNIPVVGEGIGEIHDAAKGVVTNVGTGVNAAIKTGGTLADTVVGGVSGKVESAMTTVGDKAKSVTTTVSDNVGKATGHLTNAVQETSDAIKALLPFLRVLQAQAALEY